MPRVREAGLTVVSIEWGICGAAQPVQRRAWRPGGLPQLSHDATSAETDRRQTGGPLITQRPSDTALLQQARVPAGAKEGKPAAPILPCGSVRYEQPFQVLQPEARVA